VLNSGKPEFSAIHPPSDFLAKKMDARVISAFTRVHSPSKTGVNALQDALLLAHVGPPDGEHRAWRDRTACPI
jgi:hypothetical protein